MGERTITTLIAKTPMDQKLAALTLSTIEGMGFRLVRLRLMGGGRPTLQVMAERPDGSMEVDDCAELSRALSALLDVEDPIEGEYVLEVSSPGIDRPLTRPEDFERYAGFEAKLELAEPIDGRKRFRGRLAGVEGEGAAVAVAIEGAEFGAASAPFAALADAKLMLTDDLIAASLKGQAARPGYGDGAEIELDDEEGPETAEEMNGAEPDTEK